MIKTLKLATLTAAVLMSFALCANAAEKTTFQPESGGYRVEIPTTITEIYRTTQGVRYVEGTQLVNMDIYPLPNFIANPIKNYSEQQANDFKKFLADIEDYPGFTLDKSALDEKNMLSKDEQGYSFTLNPPANSKIARNFIIGKAYQLSDELLLVIRISAPEKDKILAKSTLENLADNLKLSKPKYIEDNIIKAKQLDYEITLPNRWHAFTLLADNIIMAKSLSSVHNDKAMIRSFRTKEFTAMANADAKSLPAEEKAFVEKITKFTPNVNILRHEAVVANGINGAIIESTEVIDLKKTFIVNAYFFTKDECAYQIIFDTDDTINSELKIKAFKNAIMTFQRTK